VRRGGGIWKRPLAPATGSVTNREVANERLKLKEMVNAVVLRRWRRRRWTFTGSGGGDDGCGRERESGSLVRFGANIFFLGINGGGLQPYQYQRQ